MADSAITKRALAAALRELMRERPFERITVADICEKCGMHRKSFYYHFRDKYELMNWIFDTEISEVLPVSRCELSYVERWGYIEAVCVYLYKYRDFYRRALRIRGQNSFVEHFGQVALPLIKNRLRIILGEDMADDFGANFFADAILCAIERWLLEKDCIPPEEFVSRIKRLVQCGAQTLLQEITPRFSSEEKLGKRL